MSSYNMRRKNIRKWILLAHRSGARLYVASGNEIRILREVDNPDGRRQNREIDTDAKGSRFSTVAGRSSPSGTFHSRQQKHGLDPQMEAAEHLADGFAHQLCEWLNQGRARSEFDELVVVAEPGFLGKIKRFLDKETQARLIEAIPHNWTALPKKQLQDKLKELTGKPNLRGLTRAA